MMIFNVCVGWNNCYDRHFGTYDPEIVIEQVPIDGNAQSVVAGTVVAGNCNHVITRVGYAPHTNIFGEWNR